MGIIRKEDIHNTFDDYIRDMHSNYNLLINGDFQVWQRGTSFSVTILSYTSDRWAVVSTDGAYPVSVTKVGNGIKLSQADGAGSFLRYIMEDSDFAMISGKTVTLSYKLNGVYNEETFVASSPLIVSIGGPGGVDYVYSEFKLELGSKATPFVPRPYGEELALCKRYYEVIDRVFRTTGFTLGDGMFAIEYPFLVEKRVPPTVVLPSDKTELIEVVGARNSTPTNLECFTTIGGVRFTGVLANDANRIVGLNFRTYADAEIY